VRADLDKYLAFLEKVANTKAKGEHWLYPVDKIFDEALLAAIRAVRAALRNQLDPVELELSTADATIRGLVKVAGYEDEWVKVQGDATQVSGELGRAPEKVQWKGDIGDHYRGRAKAHAEAAAIIATVAEKTQKSLSELINPTYTLGSAIVVFCTAIAAAVIALTKAQPGPAALYVFLIALSFSLITLTMAISTFRTTVSNAALAQSSTRAALRKLDPDGWPTNAYPAGPLPRSSGFSLDPSLLEDQAKTWDGQSGVLRSISTRVDHLRFRSVIIEVPSNASPAERLMVIRGDEVGYLAPFVTEYHATVDNVVKDAGKGADRAASMGKSLVAIGHNYRELQREGVVLFETVVK
jgi:hypothetical protein